MKKWISYCLILIGIFINQFAFAQKLNACNTNVLTSAKCVSSGVLIYEPNQSSTTFAPPSKYTTSGSIGKLQITYSIELDARNISGFTYDKTKWGVLIGDPNSSQLNYNPGASLTNIKVTADLTNLASGTNYYAGTVVVTIDFTQASNTLPSDIISKISTSGSLSLQPVYVNGSSNVSDNSLAFTWQADQGAMVNPPRLKITAQDQAFVVNLSAPSDLSALVVDTTTTPATLKTTNPNTLSGYVIVYWLDSDSSGRASGCKASPGNWKFQINPAAINGSNTNSYTCTYPQYQSSYNIGGTSSAIGCASAGMTGILSSLSADNAAVPYTPSYSNPNQIPSDSNGTPSGCYNVVYVPGSQSSWSKGNIKNGEIYGLMAWALNNAYDSSANTVKPNYSLAHSNISYVTGINISLASTDKTPDLPKSKDCFVVTAASGNPNSLAVFYWRILRDEYLTPIGFTKFYYQHAQSWANWLDQHPRLKPPLNFIFETSGKSLYKLSGFWKSTKEFFSKNVTKVKTLFIQEASAQELPAEPTILNTEKKVTEQAEIPPPSAAQQDPPPTVESKNSANTTQQENTSSVESKNSANTTQQENTSSVESKNSANTTQQENNSSVESKNSANTTQQENTSSVESKNSANTKAEAEKITSKETNILPKSEPIKEQNLNKTSVNESEKDHSKSSDENNQNAETLKEEEEDNSSPKINKNIMPLTPEQPPTKVIRDKSVTYYYPKEQQPNYDLFITGGILLPTDDKTYYDRYYNSQQTAHIDLGANYIWWFFDYLGISLGIQGKYVFNKGSGNISVLGTQQNIDRQFYALIAEGIIGARFRHPGWTYIQPGVYFGAGVNRFREDANTNSTNTNSSTDKPLGVTKYSPIYEIGANLDFSLVPIFSVTPGELGIYLSDILLRFSVAYNNNPTPALSTTGLFVQGGFVFLFE